MSKIKDAIYMPGGYVYNCHYHLIWVTKYREVIFNKIELVNDMKQLLVKIARLNNIDIQAMEVMPDHIHLLVSFPPRMSITNVMKAFKGGSARLWFAKHPETKAQLYGGHLWSRSYYVGTVGNMSKEVVRKYILNQRTHRSASGRRPQHSSGE